MDWVTGTNSGAGIVTTPVVPAGVSTVGSAEFLGNARPRMRFSKRRDEIKIRKSGVTGVGKICNPT